MIAGTPWWSWAVLAALIFIAAERALEPVCLAPHAGSDPLGLLTPTPQ